MPIFVFTLYFFVANIQCLKAQTPYPGCPNVSQIPDDPSLTLSNDTLYLNCNQTCANIEASFLETGASSKYKVESVAYAPPFPATGGTPLFVNRDDVYSGIINLSFNFCFYGNTYNQVVVGANGMITFDATKANGPNCYTISNPIPNAAPANCAGILGAAGNGNMVYNSIYGPFLDLDPTQANPDINFAVLGTAPCRTFVLNYTNVAQFSCNNLLSTQQIVMYETTNVIEIYVKKREVCPGWNDGLAVIGIQNANGSLATSPPGRNTGTWTANNEAWRFTPDGPANYTLKWFDEDHNFVSSSPNIQVCTPDPTVSTLYTIEVEYTNCDGTIVLVEDSVHLVARPELTADFITKSARCFEECDGSAEINVLTGDGPFIYTWPNGVTNSTNFVDTLCKGSYTIQVEDKYGCVEDFNFNVIEPTKLTTTTSSEVVSCFSLLDGTGEVVANGGTPPYDIQWSNGDTGDKMTDGAGKYYVTVTDDSLCVAVDSVFITEPDLLTFDTNITPLTCPVEKDGVIEFLPKGGNPPYQYSIDNGATYKASTTFSNLSSNTYQLRLKDNKGCEFAYSVFVPQDIISLNAPNDTTICEGQSLTFTATGDYTNISWNNGVTNGIAFSPTALGPSTYTVTVQNSSGCELKEDVILTVEEIKDPSITSAGPFCANADDFQLIATDAGGVWNGPGVDANGLFSPNTAGQGTHTITYSFPSFCPTSDTIQIGVNNTFDAAINPAGPFCELGSPFKLTSVTPGGKWFGTGIIDVIDSLKSDFSPAIAGPGMHKVYHSLSGTCGDLDSTTIEVIAAEEALITLPVPEFCPSGTSQQLNATPTGGTWSGTGIGSTGIFDPTITGSGSFKVFYTPSSSCRTIDSAIVNVVSPLTGSGEDKNVLCNGNNTTLTTTISGGKMPYTFSWSNGISSSTESATNVAAGNYSVLVTDDLGCSLIIDHSVTEPTKLDTTAPAQISPTSCNSNCDGTVTFSAIGGTVAGNYTYGLTPLSGTFNGSNGFTGLCPGNYTVTISDDNQCSINQNFSIGSPPAIVIMGTASPDFCNQSVGSVSITSVSGGVSANGTYTYSWSNGTTNRDLTNVTSGMYTLTVFDDNNCLGTQVFNVQNSGGPSIANKGFEAVTCFGGNDAKAYIQATGGDSPYTYLWDTGSITDTAFALSAGTYNVTVTDNNGCTVNENVIVTEPSMVQIDEVRDSLLCDGQTFNTSFSANNGNGAPYTYIVNGTTLSSNTFSTSTPGNYTVYALDSKSCQSDNTNFTVSYLSPLSAQINNIAPTCPGDIVTLTCVANGGDGNYSYNWNNGALNGQSIQYQTNNTGIPETLNVLVSDGCSTPVMATITITFNNLPSLTPIFSPSEGCESLDVNISISDQNFQSITWTLGESMTIENQINFDYTFVNSGNYTVNIDAITQEGCNISANFKDTIQVHPIPKGIIQQNPEKITVISNYGLFKVNGSNNIVNVAWELSRNNTSIFKDSTLRFEYDFPEDTGTYYLHAILISDKGCISETDALVKVLPERKLFVPTAFTPNGDGVNETFSISGFGLTDEDFEIQIFNRWGEVVFKSNRLNFEWDGTYNGDLSPSGTYAFKILYNDGPPKKVLVKGKISLIR